MASHRSDYFSQLCDSNKLIHMGRMGIKETPFIGQSLRSTSKGTQGLGPLKILSLRSKSQKESLARHIWIVPSKGLCVEAQSLACGVLKRWITTVPNLPMGLSITEFILMGLPGGDPNGGSRPLGLIIEGWILLLSSYSLSACLAPMEEVAFLHHSQLMFGCEPKPLIFRLFFSGYL